MKFEIKQEKFANMLEKIYFKDTFPSSILFGEGKTIKAIQKEEHGRVMRYVKFEEGYFESIEESDDVIEIDTKKTLDMIKRIPSNTNILFELKGNKLSIRSLSLEEVKGKDVDIRLSYKEPDSEVKKELSFSFEKGVPVIPIGNTKIALDTYFTIKTADLKSVIEWATPLKTEFYKFSYDKKQPLGIQIRTGDIHEWSDCVLFNPEGEIKTGEELNVTFTYGIQQIANIFEQKEIQVRTKTHSPAWFFEKGDNYIIGVLLPPYVPDDEV